MATSPVSGSHSFIDSSGNRLDIVCQDRNCAKSTNGNAFAVFLGTAGSVGNPPKRWSFVDVGGILYGANDKRDLIMRYDGTTRTSAVGVPQGSILELTQDRLAVGDISGQPNRVHYSSAGAYEQFTLGVNPEDSFFDDIGAAGDRIRGIKCIGGNCFIFKTASITLCEMANQYNTQCSVISPNIGTTDPASIVAAGSTLYFRAQDKNYWEIDRGGLAQISKKIPNLVKSQSGGLGGGENSNTQTTQADFQAGVQNPLLSWNAASVPGSIFPSSFTFRDSAAAAFSSGTFTGPLSLTATGTLAVGAIPSTYTFRYEGEEVLGSASPVWSVNDFDSGCSDSVANSTFTIACSGPPATHRRYLNSISFNSAHANLLVMRGRSSPEGNGIMSLGFWNSSYNSNSGLGIGFVASVQFRGVNVSATPNKTYFHTGPALGSLPDNSYANGTSQTLTTTFSTFTVLISSYTSGSAIARFWENGIFKASAAVTTVPDYIVLDANNFGDGGSNESAFYDFIYYARNVADPGNVDLGVSTFTSRIFDTTFSTPISASLISTGSAPSGTSLSWLVRNSSSPNNDVWTSYVAISTGAANRFTLNKRYWQYSVVFGTNNYVNAPEIQAASLDGATTGQFITQCIQPNASISAWGTLSCAEIKVGGGSLVYYATSAATCAGLPSNPPVNAAGATQNGWTAQTNNATVTIATNTAVYIGWRSLLGSATDQAQVDSCILSWNEGTPTQPAWAVYDSIKNAVYWTTTIGGAASTNRLLKFDRNLGQWYPFDIPAQAPRVINNTLYFGGASSGTWNTYGLVDADAGNAINAYWTSKDVGSDRPFQGKSFKSISVLSRNNGSGNLTGTWTLSNAQTGSYTISLSTGTGINYARSNYFLPLASPQQFLNLKIGNNSSTPFEVLGIGINWSVLPWKVEGP